MEYHGEDGVGTEGVLPDGAYFGVDEAHLCCGGRKRSLGQLRQYHILQQHLNEQKLLFIVVLCDKNKLTCGFISSSQIFLSHLNSPYHHKTANLTLLCVLNLISYLSAVFIMLQFSLVSLQRERSLPLMFII